VISCSFIRVSESIKYRGGYKEQGMLQALSGIWIWAKRKKETWLSHWMLLGCFGKGHRYWWKPDIEDRWWTLPQRDGRQTRDGSERKVRKTVSKNDWRPKHGLASDWCLCNFLCVKPCLNCMVQDILLLCYSIITFRIHDSVYVSEEGLLKTVSCVFVYTSFVCLRSNVRRRTYLDCINKKGKSLWCLKLVKSHVYTYK